MRTGRPVRYPLMKIEILRTTVADKRIVRAGTVEDVSEKDAKALILLGKAIAADDAIVVEQPSEPLNTETAEAVISEDRPKRGRKSKGF